jgi:hypothetical protein
VSNPRTIRARVRRLLGAPRGQSTVEYSVVAHAILIMGSAGLMPVWIKLFNAFSRFLDSMYYVIQSGAL